MSSVNDPRGAHLEMTRLIAGIVTLATLTSSLALAQSPPQPKPAGSGGLCPHDYMSSGSFCVGAAPNGEGYDLNFENVPVAPLARAAFKEAVAEKPSGRFMIRSRTRVVKRHPEGDW